MSFPYTEGVSELHLEAGDTIVAVSTPPGRGGIGVVRLSGPRAASIASALMRGAVALEHGRARFAVLIDEHGERVDECVVTFFQGPHSYTGDDVAEIAAHGSPVVLEWVVRACVDRGARAARPGEFTERAFLNHRLDLTQAEAVRDLIDAQTMEQARVAAEQMGGALATQIAPAKRGLVELIAALEAGIDFAEDDIETMPSAEIVNALKNVRAPMEVLLKTFAYGGVLRAGLKLAIVGAPNAGKSSLFNRLVERERAIVTAVAGTTRDVVSERVSMGGVPVELLDTAGLREATDEVERIGIARSEVAMAEADVVLVVVVVDAAGHTLDDTSLLLERLTGRSVVVVENKIDLLTASDPLAEEAKGRLKVSALTGEGVDALRTRLIEVVSGGAVAARDGVLTNLRQRDAVQRCVDGLARAEEAATQSVPDEMVLLDVYDALRGMDELTGATTADDVLHLIFSSFCIGK